MASRLKFKIILVSPQFGKDAITSLEKIFRGKLLVGCSIWVSDLKVCRGLPPKEGSY